MTINLEAAPAPIKAVFFDAVGTLIHPEPAAGVVYAQVGRQLNSRYSAVDITARFKAAFKQEEQIDQHQGWRTSEERELARWRDIVARVLDDVCNSAECFRTLYDHFAQPRSWRIDQGMLGIIASLINRGCTVGLASNFDGRLRAVLAGFPELHCLHPIVISADVGWRKPAPQFFSAVCEAVQLPARQILFVGDDRINDHEGALAAGMQSVLITDSREIHSVLAMFEKANGGLQITERPPSEP